MAVIKSLAEAVRLGSLILSDHQGGSAAKCAIGMGLVANGYEFAANNYPRYHVSNRNDDPYLTFAQMYPWLNSRVLVICPLCTVAVEGYQTIVHMYDAHVSGLRAFPKVSMTLEQLCDFLDQLQKTHDPSYQITTSEVIEQEQVTEQVVNELENIN